MADNTVQYRFLAAVGEGGFGKVYRARLETGEGFHKDVAIKVLSSIDPPSALLERFRDEARILGLIRDRAIVDVEPPIRIGERWAVVMEFVDGCSCARILEEGFVPAGVAVEIVGEVARALHSAYHQEGPEGQPLQLLHRDIKPENIQLTPQGDVRVLDFGIARANFAAREFHTVKALGGTPGYIAPERTKGIEVPEGDVFSLGVVLHQLITRQRPDHSTRIDDAATHDGVLLPSHIQVDDRDLQLDEALLEPEIVEVLRLAAWMRADDPEKRPSARQVEEACRDLRRTLPPPYFRDWAEERVPARTDLPPDHLVGKVLTSATGGAEYSLGALGLEAPIAGERGLPEGGQGIAVGAMLGGGVVLLAAGLGVLLVALGLGLMWWNSQGAGVASRSAPVAEDPQGVVEALPAPAAAPAAPARPSPSQGEDEAETAGSRSSTAPPTVPDAEPKQLVIRLEPSAPSPSPAPDPAPSYEMALPERPTGRVLIETMPKGSVWLAGERLEPIAPSRYALPVGTHKLELRAPGEKPHVLPLRIRRGESNEPVCYSFATNGRCVR